MFCVVICLTLVLGDTILETEEIINALTEQMKANAYKEEYEDITDIHYNFLMECFEADKKLQKMVTDRFGEGFISFVFLPIKDTDPLNTFGFRLMFYDTDENFVGVKKRYEIIYQDFCNTCFGSFVPFYDRIVEYYENREG